MECLALAPTKEEGVRWQEVLEDQGEGWRCIVMQRADDALARMQSHAPDALLLGPCDASVQLLSRFSASVLPPTPYVLCIGWAHPLADGCFSPSRLSDAAQQLQAWSTSLRLPIAAHRCLPAVTCLATALLHSLGFAPRLRAWIFLPDLLALCAVHPALLCDLNGRLYPLCARRHGLNAALVERRLRLALESTWSRAKLTALERFFGHSVDPEKGKPTNKEFLWQMAERLSIAMKRMQHS